MKSALRKKFFAIFTILSVNFSIFSAQKVPELTSAVVDEANLFHKSKKNQLDSELQSIYSQGGPQIAVLTIKSLDGESIESFSMRVAENWKLGSKSKDDGVLLTVALQEKKIRIEVGYGLEGELTDSKCGMIIRNIMAPEFRTGDYEEGIIQAVNSIQGILGINGKEIPDELESSGGRTNPSFFVILIIFGLIYFFIFSGTLSIKFPWLSWLPWAHLFHSTRSSRHFDNWDDKFDHFGGFGGSSGGGFSGGGGSFGGGGASGGW